SSRKVQRSGTQTEPQGCCEGLCPKSFCGRKRRHRPQAVRAGRWSAYSSARKSTSRLTGQHLGAGHISRRGKIISVVSHFEKRRHNLINLASNLGPVARLAAVLVGAAQGLYRWSLGERLLRLDCNVGAPSSLRRF